MSDERNIIERFRSESPEVATIIDTYEEIDSLYQEVLKAIGASEKATEAGVQNSANITVSFQSSSSVAIG